MRRTAWVAAALVAAALAPAHALASPKPVTGTAIAWTQGFHVRLWDTVNGARTIEATGYAPALSADGRFLVYVRKGSVAACYQIVLWDVRARRRVPLPGVNDADCADEPTISGDGSLLAWRGPSAVPGDPSDIFLYSVRDRVKIPVPRGDGEIDTDSTEEHPSLSADGRLLAFTSGRSGFDDVLLYDLVARALVPTPGLPTDGAQRTPVISGDGSAIAYVDGPDLGRRAHLYLRADGSVVDLPGGNDVYDPAPNADGSVVAYAAQAVDLGDRAVRLWRRATGRSAAVAALAGTNVDEAPSIQTPVELVDVTKPRIALACRRVRRAVTCTLTTDEAVRGTIAMRLGRRTTSRPVRIATQGKRKASFTLPKASSRPTFTADVRDTSGNRATRTARLAR